MGQAHFCVVADVDGAAHAATDACALSTMQAALRSILERHGLDASAWLEPVSAALEDEGEVIGSALDVHEILRAVLDEVTPELSAEIFAVCERPTAAPAKRGTKRSTPPHTESADSAEDGAQQSWLTTHEWKREYKSTAERFEQPYEHAIGPGSLVLVQAPFGPEGFASTVWDSSIVLARYLETQRADGVPEDSAAFAGARCVELGAGCGLPGLVLASLGAEVVMTDLAANLPLLRANAEANARLAPAARVAPLQWVEEGESLPSDLALPAAVDLVVGTDLFYTAEAVPALVATLDALSALGEGERGAPVLLAAGRNRQAADAFFEAAAQRFEVACIAHDELHSTYRCLDVDVWKLRRRS